MTDFLAWWADHWPLLVAILLYPIYHETVAIAFYNLKRWFWFEERQGRIERRRGA